VLGGGAAAAWEAGLDAVRLEVDEMHRQSCCTHPLMTPGLRGEGWVGAGWEGVGWEGWSRSRLGGRQVGGPLPALRQLCGGRGVDEGGLCVTPGPLTMHHLPASHLLCAPAARQSHPAAPLHYGESLTCCTLHKLGAGAVTFCIGLGQYVERFPNFV
jgi:hypothetical protein